MSVPTDGPNVGLPGRWHDYAVGAVSLSGGDLVLHSDDDVTQTVRLGRLQ